MFQMFQMFQRFFSLAKIKKAPPNPKPQLQSPQHSEKILARHSFFDSLEHSNTLLFSTIKYF